MKTLTLTQPWASFVAFGLKTIETRSWGTGYTGPLAIHAAKGFPKWARELCKAEYADVFAMADLTVETLPRGVIVAKCRLAACGQIGPGSIFARTSQDPRGAYFDRNPDGTSLEERLGDFSIGRYAWILREVKRVDPPIPATGALGLWEWEWDAPFGSTR